MSARFQKLTSLVVLICLIPMLFSWRVYAVAPTVKLIVSPNQKEIPVGSEPLALTAQATGLNLTYKWVLNGPGKISGTDQPALFYTPPGKIDGKSAQAVITVTVTDKAGQEVTESMTLKILAGAIEEKQASPKPKKGMSTTTKVAIGVGAAALVGGGIALAIGGEDKEEATPFTGSFKREDYDTDSYWSYYWSYTFNLTQKGKTITGNLVLDYTLINCCSVTVSVPVNGTANGNSATLSWGEGEEICSCNEWSGPIRIDANSGHVTLMNDGKILRFDEGAEYTRMFVAGCFTNDSETADEITLPFVGDFIRQ